LHQFDKIISVRRKEFGGQNSLQLAPFESGETVKAVSFYTAINKAAENHPPTSLFYPNALVILLLSSGEIESGENVKNSGKK